MITLQETTEPYTLNIHCDSRWVGNYIYKPKTEPVMVFIQAQQGQIAVRDLRVILAKIKEYHAKSEQPKEDEVQQAPIPQQRRSRPEYRPGNSDQ